MADRTQEARRRRTAARDSRRSRVSEPFEELDHAARDQAREVTEAREVTGQPNGELAGTAAKVVGTAVAAAVLGAVGGAAKALLDRRGSKAPRAPESEDRDGDEAPEATATAESPDREHQDGGAEPEPAGEAEQSEPHDESEEPAPDSADAEVDQSGTNVRGVTGDEAAEIVAQARSQLESLLGTEAERVSGLERVDDRWSVMLEVVEVARIPESTDLLATYEFALDDDRNLVSVTRRRRYRRSQADEAA